MDKERLPRKDVLQNCLDRVLSGQESLESVLARHPDLAETLRPELDTALWLTSVQASLDPRPAFVTASCRRLVAERFKPQGWQRRSRVPPFFQRVLQLFPKRWALQASLVVLLGMTLLIGNVFSAAAQNTIPGDTLYPVKMFSEEVQLTFSVNPSWRAQLCLTFARRRVAEIEALMLEGRYDRAEATLDHFDRQVSQAMSLLEGLRHRNVAEARELGGSLNRLLDDQSQVIGLLMASAPKGMKPQLDVAVRASQERNDAFHTSINNMGVLLAATPAILAPQRTGTPTAVVLGASPTYTPDRSDSSRSTPTSTPKLVKTPRPTNTLTPTQRVAFSPTPRPSNTPRPTSTPEPTNTPTPKPTNTRRPTNTHRPPKTEDPAPKPTKTRKP